MNARIIRHIIPARPAQDGDGVKLHRVISPGGMQMLDPFLMLDEISSDEAADYIGGFPPHPHRGFETVTYMLDGHMRHEDHMGNVGHLKSGGVQWMTAARGVIHSEMPEQEDGKLHGFQLWINLPAAEKMKPASYRDIPASEIPEVYLPGGGRVRLVAGELDLDGQTTAGAVIGISTQPLFFDVQLNAGERVSIPVAEGHTAIVHVFEGSLTIAGEAVPRQHLAMLQDGDSVTLSGGESGGRALLLAAKPIGEPVVHYGPFVMNTREEIEQALADYRDGRLTA